MPRFLLLFKYFFQLIVFLIRFFLIFPSIVVCMIKLLLPVFLCAALGAIAQPDKVAQALMTTPDVNTTESTTLHGDGVRKTIEAKVISEPADFTKFWRSYLKENFNVSGKKEGNYLVCGPIVSAQLSVDTVFLYYQISSDADFSKLSVFAIKKGEYIVDSDGAEKQSLVALTEKAMVQFYTQLYDIKIKIQQRYYDRQVKDLARVDKDGARLEKEKASHEQSISKLQNQLSSSRANINKIESDKKEFEINLEDEKKESNQIKKEIEQLEQTLRTKESEYAERFPGADITDKKAEKARGDLEDRREKIIKQQAKLEKKNERVTAVENKILQSERKLHDAQSSVERQEAEITRHKSDLDSLFEKQKANKTANSEEADQVSAAKSDLDRLKTAKGGLITLN